MIISRSRTWSLGSAYVRSDTSSRMNSTDSLNPAERCPAYGVPEDVATAVREKQRRDDIETAELINRGIPQRSCYGRRRRRRESDLRREGKVAGRRSDPRSFVASIDIRRGRAAQRRATLGRGALASAAMPPIVGHRRQGDLLAGGRARAFMSSRRNSLLHRRAISIILLVFSRLKDALENRA